MESDRLLVIFPLLADHLNGLKLLNGLLGDADPWEDGLDRGEAVADWGRTSSLARWQPSTVPEMVGLGELWSERKLLR